jgi:hypothetical protein
MHLLCRSALATQEIAASETRVLKFQAFQGGRLCYVILGRRKFGGKITHDR